MSYRFLDSTVLGTPLKNESFNIIGAGISGLLIGYFLKKKKIPFKIYEISNRSGGLIRTDKNKFGISEAAANGFLWCEEIQAIADDIGAEIISPSENSKAKYLVRNKKCFQFPLTFIETIQMAGNIISPHFSSPQTLKELGDTYFSKIFSEQILNPAMGGIYAGDIGQMSFPGSLPKMAKLIDKTHWLPLAFGKFLITNKKSRKKSIHSFKGGMQTFIDKLTEFLKGDIVFNFDAIQLINSKEAILITTPAFVAFQFFANNELTGLLNQVQYPSIVSATFIFNKNAFRNLRNGFGCVIPRNEGLLSMGVLFNSVIFEDRVFDNNYISLTCIANDKLLFSKTMNELKEIFEKELNQLFGMTEKSLEYKIYIHPKGIPLYSPHLYHSWFKINELLQLNYPNIRLFGNYTGTISIRGLAQEAAKAVY